MLATYHFNHTYDMRIAIIGAGNMGGAIACGLAQGHFTETRDISVANPHNEKLQ